MSYKCPLLRWSSSIMPSRPIGVGPMNLIILIRSMRLEIARNRNRWSASDCGCPSDMGGLAPFRPWGFAPCPSGPTGASASAGGAFT
eukprot:5568866-Heterocapsa_arctica.AAC.1